MGSKSCLCRLWMSPNRNWILGAFGFICSHHEVACKKIYKKLAFHFCQFYVPVVQIQFLFGLWIKNPEPKIFVWWYNFFIENISIVSRYFFAGLFGLKPFSLVYLNSLWNILKVWPFVGNEWAFWAKYYDITINIEHSNIYGSNSRLVF